MRKRKREERVRGLRGEGEREGGREREEKSRAEQIRAFSKENKSTCHHLDLIKFDIGYFHAYGS